MRSALADCRAIIEAATAGVDDAQGAVRAEGRWSIAEIVEHLDRTYTGTVKGLTRTFESGHRRVTPATFRTRTRKLVVVTLGIFPSGIEAPRHVVPTGALSLSTLVPQVASHLADMDQALLRAADRFGRQPVMDHPILGPFSAADWMRFHLVHTEHHARQIRHRREAFGVSRPDRTK